MSKIDSYWKRLAEGLMGVDNVSAFNQDDWEFAGDDYSTYGTKRRDYFAHQYIIPVHSDHCACSHDIVQNCYVVNKKLHIIAVVGNCCINKFTGEHRQKCENCGVGHKNRNNNSCKACRKLWQCKIKTCKKYLNVLEPSRQDKMCSDCKKKEDENQKLMEKERLKQVEDEKRLEIYRLKQETKQKQQDDNRAKDVEDRKNAKEVTCANLKLWQDEENKRIAAGGDPSTPIPRPDPTYVKCSKCKMLRCEYDKLICDECSKSIAPKCLKCGNVCGNGYTICKTCAFRKCDKCGKNNAKKPYRLCYTCKFG
jgi:hypothetical protein